MRNPGVILLCVVFAVVAVSAALADYFNFKNTSAKNFSDSQVAEGEWKIEVQTPPCSGYKNFEVIYPKTDGGPVIIECNKMPVKTR